MKLLFFDDSFLNSRQPSLQPGQSYDFKVPADPTGRNRRCCLVIGFQEAFHLIDEDSATSIITAYDTVIGNLNTMTSLSARQTVEKIRTIAETRKEAFQRQLAPEQTR